MSSRPVISHSPNGDVTMEIQSNGMTFFLRLSPDVARQVAIQISRQADAADKINARREEKMHEFHSNDNLLNPNAEVAEDA